MFRSLNRHLSENEKSRLEILYVCETNEPKVDVLRKELKKYGSGVDYPKENLNSKL